MRVIGVDPGSKKHGVAILLFDGSRISHHLTFHVDTDALVAILRKEDASTIVGIETSSGVFAGVARKRGAQAAISVAAASTPAIRADGFVEGVCVGLGLTVLRCAATEWRRALCSNAQAEDSQIAFLISNAHERDAAGVAVFVGRQFRGASRLLLGMDPAREHVS